MNYRRLEELLVAADEDVKDTIMSILRYEESKMHQQKPNYKKDVRTILEERVYDHQRNLV